MVVKHENIQLIRHGSVDRTFANRSYPSSKFITTIGQKSPPFSLQEVQGTIFSLDQGHHLIVIIYIVGFSH